MDHAPSPLLAHIAHWSEPAQARMWACRTLYHEVARQTEVGRLDETLKWGQPSWRPITPRTGATLRMGWAQATPDLLSFYVDCKTDLAARIRDNYPDLPVNDGRRHIGVALDRELPEQAIRHLAQMTFTYHRATPRRRA